MLAPALPTESGVWQRGARDTLIDLITEVSRKRALSEPESELLERLIRDAASNSSRLRWTAAQDEALLRLWNSGKPATVIAAALDRTPYSVRDRLKTLRRSKPELFMLKPVGDGFVQLRFGHAR